MRRLVLAGIFAAASWLTYAGDLDDMELRSNVESGIRGNAATANLQLKIDVEDGVAIPQGRVKNLNQADDVVALAAKVRGITRVDRSRLISESAPPEDDELASRLTRALSELPRYGSSLKVAVDRGVATLTGTIKNAAWRGDLRRLCGAEPGVVDVVDLIETPATPDERIQKALDGVFGMRATPRFPGRVRAEVKDGTVTLTGHVPRLRDKLVAEVDSFGINGVRRIDNRLELESGTAIKVIRP